MKKAIVLSTIAVSLALAFITFAQTTAIPVNPATVFSWTDPNSPPAGRAAVWVQVNPTTTRAVSVTNNSIVMSNLMSGLPSGIYSVRVVLEDPTGARDNADPSTNSMIFWPKTKLHSGHGHKFN